MYNEQYQNGLDLQIQKYLFEKLATCEQSFVTE